MPDRPGQVLNGDLQRGPPVPQLDCHTGQCLPPHSIRILDSTKNKLVIMNDIRYHVLHGLISRTGGGTCLRNRFPRTLGGTRISPGWTATRNGRTWLDRAREHDEPPAGRGVRGLRAAHRGGAGRRSARRPPMSCSRSRRPPPGGGDRASPAPRGSSPASRPARRPRSARGCRWTCCPAARSWRSPPTPPEQDDRFAGVSEAELVGVVCAWDRVEAHAAARKLAAIGRAGAAAIPSLRTRSSPRTRWRTRWGSPGARADEPDGHGRVIWTPTCPAPRAALRDGT